MDPLTMRRRVRARFIAVVIGLLITGLAGYVGFVSFVGSDRAVGAATLALGATTGFAAFFSPCSFPLLLTFLARRSSTSMRESLASALRAGAGATAFLALAAILVATVGGAVAGVVAFDTATGRVFRSLVGFFLIVMGLRHARVVAFRMPWLDRVAAATHGRLDPMSVPSLGRRDFVYGFGYLLAGFG